MKKVLLGVLALSLTGCASMFHGSTQQISIRSNVPDTELYVNEGFIGKDNGVAVFQKSKNYVIAARKKGCEQNQVTATKSFDATTLLGLPIDFGVISILIVDGVGTGAWQQFDQTSYVLDPKCK